MLPDQLAPPDVPQDANVSPLGAAGGPAEGPAPVGGEPPDPREPVLAACADAIKAIAARVTVSSSPDEAKGYGQGAQAFAQAMALLNPPMKPIDPNLHADHRGVDPQSVFDAEQKAEETAAAQAHEAEQQTAEQAHEAGLKAVEVAAQQQQPPKPSA